MRFLAVDIQKDKTFIEPGKFKIEKVPYMSDLLKDLDIGKTEVLKIMKPQACGCTESIMDNALFYYDKHQNEQELFKYFDKLKLKYPNWDRR